MLRDILKGEDGQIAAVVDVIAAVNPDILHLSDIDFDLTLAALSALRDRLAASGADYPFLFALLPNTGQRTGIDMDGDGRADGPGDAQGYGRFSGQGGMAILSRLPIARDEARDFSAYRWADLPGHIMPGGAEAPFPSTQAAAIQRLSSVGHWDVPIALADGRRLHLLAFHATTPVFDGPEDRNGRRNHDEIGFWPLLLEGRLPFAPPAGPVVVLGDANLDPADGDGRRAAIAALLAHPALQDPMPKSRGGAGAADVGQRGDPALDTADWDEPLPGNLRVDYVLPDTALGVAASRVYWPAPGEAGHEAAMAASRHRLVWIDVEMRP